MASPEYLPADRTAAADQLRALAQDLNAQEAVIERGLQSFTEIGIALQAIRDQRLYRHEYCSFEVYCQQRWQLSRSRAYRLIDAARITDAMDAVLGMSPIGDTVPLPSNEAQARELVGLTPEEAVQVMGRASEATSGNPTASAIRDARQPEPEPDCIDDPAVDAPLPPGFTAEELAVTGTDGKTYTPKPRPEPTPEPDWIAAAGGDEADAAPMPPGFTSEDLAELNRPADKPAPQEQAKPKRRPLTEAFDSASYELRKAVERVVRLAEDDRLAKNKDQVADANLANLVRVRDALTDVITQLEG